MEQSTELGNHEEAERRAVDEGRGARRRFLNKVEEIQKRMKLAVEEADELAREAVQAVRKQRRA